MSVALPGVGSPGGNRAERGEVSKACGEKSRVD